MQTRFKHLMLPFGLMVVAVLACNFSTANISKFRMSADKDGKDDKSTVKPGEKIWAVADISNNPGKVKVKFRVMYDDVKDKKSGDVVSAFDSVNDKVLDIEGSRPAYLELTFPSAGAPNGKYKVEVKMLNENDEVKDTKTATFNVEGYSDTAGGGD